MTLRYFEGPAGCGKTTSLLKAVIAELTSTGLAPMQRILALSFMHGARRRLHQRLASDEDVRHPFECLTIDSFARRIASRWRTLIEATGHQSDPEHDHFEQVLRAATHAANHEHVRRWIGWSFPIIVVDEFQDCSPRHLDFLGAIEPGTTMLAAADAFQHLAAENENPAVAFLTATGDRTTLTGNHRTHQAGLLGAARRVRAGDPLRTGRQERGLYVQPAYTPIQAAPAAARTLTWHGGTHDAILCPSGPETARFFAATVERLQTTPLRIKKTQPEVGPFRIRWVQSQPAVRAAHLDELHLGDDRADTDTVDLATVQRLPRSAAKDTLISWLRRRAKLRGHTSASVQEARAAIEQALIARHAHRPTTARGIEAMTIHQAKNQEFDCVIVLWPVEISTNPTLQRRLLYNAITRARKHACILIQDPQGKRLQQPREQELFGPQPR